MSNTTFEFFRNQDIIKIFDVNIDFGNLELNEIKSDANISISMPYLRVVHQYVI